MKIVTNYILFVTSLIQITFLTIMNFTISSEIPEIESNVNFIEMSSSSKYENERIKKHKKINKQERVFLNATNYKKLIKRKNKNKNSTNSNNGTCIIKGIKNSSDAVGIVGEPDFALMKFPYVLDSCDQVLLIKGTTVKSENLLSSKPAFLTLSAYMINLFDKKNSEKLLKSISLDKIKAIPAVIKGAPLCLKFSSLSDEINFCFKSKKNLENIFNNYKQFLACRKGFPVDHSDCLDKIDFSNKGPFGKMGMKIKKEIERSKLLMLDDIAFNKTYSNNSERKIRMKKNRTKLYINPYYSIKKVPGTE